MFIHSYCVSRIHGHIFIFMDMVLIFPATEQSAFSPKSVVGRLYSYTESDRRVTYCIHLIILFRPLSFVSIEMLDKLITYITSRYVFSCVICFRVIHFILISTAHALFFTCLPVSIYGT